jgi:hypothetical protein
VTEAPGGAHVTGHERAEEVTVVINAQWMNTRPRAYPVALPRPTAAPMITSVEGISVSGSLFTTLTMDAVPGIRTWSPPV